MNSRQRTLLASALLVLILACSMATAEIRIEGNLADGSAWIIIRQSSQSLEAGQGTVHQIAGTLRQVDDRSNQGTYTRIEGLGLEPGVRFMVLADRQPLGTFQAGPAGRLTARFVSGVEREGWVTVNAGINLVETRLVVAPVSASAGVSTSQRRLPTTKNDDAYVAWTPLCSSDPAGVFWGEASVMEERDFSMFMVFAEGFAPRSIVTVLANGIEVGRVTTDEFGMLWMEASNVDDGWSEFQIPPGLLPVTVIDVVELIAGDFPALAGSFQNPCDDIGIPGDGGSISLCDNEGRDRFGYFDWVTFEDGYQAATLMAVGLDAGLAELVIDGFPVATEEVTEWGELFLAFSTDPGAGELPMPAEILPLSEIREVVVLVNGAPVLSGDDDQPCDIIEPPEPIAMDVTPLCGGSNDGSDPFGTWAEAGWTVYEDGLEELWIYADGLTPGVEHEVVIDGISLGAYGTGDWGELFLYFAASGNGLGDSIPLPDELRPISGIDVVEILEAGHAVRAGSFSDPCDNTPPIPVDGDWTSLCSDGDSHDDGNRQMAEMGWALYDNGDEALELWAAELPAGIDVEVLVDGVSLGMHATDADGSLFVRWSSSAGPGDSSLPLPDEIRPLSGIDIVELTSGDNILLAGSFSEPCDDIWFPPMAVDGDWTWMCSADDSDDSTDPNEGPGEVSWTLYDSGDAELILWAPGLPPGGSVEIFANGISLGMLPVEMDGTLFAYFATWDDDFGALPLPDAIRPLSELDIVELTSDGAVVMAGSFFDPCEPDEPSWPIDMGATDLCSDNNDSAGEVAWFTYDDGTEELFVSAFGLTGSDTFDLVVDGFNLGRQRVEDDGWFFVTFSSDPQWDGQLILPPEVQPVDAIDRVEVVAPNGDIALSGSFVEPCEVVMPVFDYGETGLCDSAGLEQGFVTWWTMSIDDQIVDEGIDIMAWIDGSEDSLSVTIDGIDVGTLGHNDPSDQRLLYLSLGQNGEAPVPSELSPVFSIDHVLVSDPNGSVFLEGSFLEPCSGTPAPPVVFQLTTPVLS